MKNIKAIHRQMGTIHQGAGDHKEESIRDKSGGAFSKKKKKRKNRRCRDLLMLKDGKKEVKPERGRGDNGHVYKSDGLERGASSAARLSFAVRDESGAPLLFFHLLLCSFITSSLEPN